MALIRVSNRVPLLHGFAYLSRVLIAAPGLEIDSMNLEPASIMEPQHVCHCTQHATHFSGSDRAKHPCACMPDGMFPEI